MKRTLLEALDRGLFVLIVGAGVAAAATLVILAVPTAIALAEVVYAGVKGWLGA